MSSFHGKMFWHRAESWGPKRSATYKYFLASEKLRHYNSSASSDYVYKAILLLQFFSVASLWTISRILLLLLSVE